MSDLSRARITVCPDCDPISRRDFIKTAVGGGAAVVSATMHVSGGQLNPAVTIALLATKKSKIDEAIAYIVSQLIGATLAGFACKMFYDTGDPTWKMGGATVLTKLPPTQHSPQLAGFIGSHRSTHRGMPPAGATHDAS